MPTSRPTSENPTAYLSRARVDWMAAHPFKEFLPDWLQPPPRQVQPLGLADIDGLKLRAVVDDKLNAAPESLGKFKTSRRQRRRIEHEVADYLEDHGLLGDIVPKLRCCRMSGHYGEEATGAVVVGWDSKCGQARLCPDESRVEQRRLVRHYKAPVLAWAKKFSRRRRIHKLVITWPNIPAGELDRFNRLMFAELADLLKIKKCADGVPRSKSFPAIQGMQVTQECPLSARGDWNLHLNAILLVDGRFDWAKFRAAWYAQTVRHFPEYTDTDFQINFRELPRDDERALEKAIEECIKYPVKHVTAKADADRLAPGLVDWPPDLFMEWWQAGLRFRRTRSYGMLFRVDAPEDLPRDGITWRGRIWWDDRGSAYAVEVPAVSLIQGDKSAVWRGKNDYFLNNRPPGVGGGGGTRDG